MGSRVAGVRRGDPCRRRRPLSGDLESALYAWRCVEEAYARACRGWRGHRALLPVAVLLGGLRHGSATSRGTPKALVPVAGEPFVFHQLRLLAAHGARRVVLCVGHLGEQIAEAVGDGRGFGVEVVYAFDGPEPVGTAGALRRRRACSATRFLVTYGDAYLRIDHGRSRTPFEAGALPGLMTVFRERRSMGRE